MDINLLLSNIKGVQTIESIMSILKVNRQKAIYLVHFLRKRGFVKTKRLSSNKRIYFISHENRLGLNYFDVINEFSPVKISVSDGYWFYGNSFSFEDVLTYAVSTRRFRVVLASIALFQKINDWKLLYKLSKEKNVVREVGALYSLSRKLMKVKRMDGRILNKMLPRKEANFKYIIPKLKSRDFKDIEKKWRVYLPFNKCDLEDYFK